MCTIFSIISEHEDSISDVILTAKDYSSFKFRVYSTTSSCQIDYWPDLPLYSGVMFGYAGSTLAICGGHISSQHQAKCFYMDMFSLNPEWIEASGELSFPKIRANGATLRGKVSVFLYIYESVIIHLII